MPDLRAKGVSGFSLDDFLAGPNVLGSARVAGLASSLQLLRAHTSALTQTLERGRHLDRIGAVEAPGAVDDLEALAGRLARTETARQDIAVEIERSTVPMPSIKPETTTYVGRITENGRGVAGVVVHAMLDQRSLAASKPSEVTGAFSLEIPVNAAGAAKVRLEAVRDGKPIGRHDSEVEVKPNGAGYAEIAIGKPAAEPGREPGTGTGRPPPDTPPAPDTLTVPDFTGMTPEKAGQAVEAGKLALGKLSTAVVRDKPGSVTAQSPSAGAQATAGAAVALTFGRSGKQADDLALMMALTEIHPAFAGTGLKRGELAERVKKAAIKNVAELRKVASEAAQLARRLEMTDARAVSALAEAAAAVGPAFNA